MIRLDEEHDVIELARELGLADSPVEAVVGFCHDRIAEWVSHADGVISVDHLESVVTEHLQLVFEEFWTDEQLSEVIKKYTSQGEGGFATLSLQFDDGTFGSLMERHNIPGDARDLSVEAR